MNKLKLLLLLSALNIYPISQAHCPLPLHEHVCDDGYDQDHDRLADCDDPDCKNDPFCEENNENQP